MQNHTHNGNVRLFNDNEATRSDEVPTTPTVVQSKEQYAYMGPHKCTWYHCLFWGTHIFQISFLKGNISNTPSIRRWGSSVVSNVILLNGTKSPLSILIMVVCRETTNSYTPVISISPFLDRAYPQRIACYVFRTSFSNIRSSNVYRLYLLVIHCVFHNECWPYWLNFDYYIFSSNCGNP